MQRTALGAFLLNILVLPFMMRPRRLAIVLAIHIAAIFSLANAAQRFHSDFLETAAYGWGLLGPAVLVAIEHVRHELVVDRPSAVTPSRPA